MQRFLIVLLLIVGLIAAPVAPAAAQDGGGGILDILGPVKNALWSFFDWLQDWFRGMICRFRIGAFNVIARYFCMQCRAIEVEPGEMPGDPQGGEGGANPNCWDIPDCQCSLCPSWLRDNKEVLSRAIGWFVGAANVLGMFIPWSFWATLHVAYIQAAVAIWFIRLVAKFGIMMFGAVT